MTWSLKYKRSINCNRPKGFSQKQYCKYGRNKNKNKNKTRKLTGGSKNNTKPVKAITYFNGEKIKGTVLFEEDLKNKCVIITINLEGLTPSHKHGFHVHECGDLTSGCESMCAHFNPYNKTHGDRTDKIRHVGDLGNLEADQYGKATYVIKDNIIKLRGNKANIIGRGLIIHADTDDCGHGDNKDSLITGNSGKRIACAIIGYAKQ
jgi:Cu-Zn family superoxide dismutase